MMNSFDIKTSLLKMYSLLEDCEKKFNYNVNNMSSCCSILKNSNVNTRYSQNIVQMKQNIENIIKIIDINIK